MRTATRSTEHASTRTQATNATQPPELDTRHLPSTSAANSFCRAELAMQTASSVRVGADKQLRVVVRVAGFHMEVLQLLRAGSKARTPLKSVFVELGRSQLPPSSARVFRLNLQIKLHAPLLGNDFIVDGKLVVTDGVTLEIDHYNRFVYEARGRSKTSVLPAQIDCTIPVASSPSVSPSELSFKCLLSREVHLTRTFKLPSGNRVLKVPISFRQLSSKVASSGPYHLPHRQMNTFTSQRVPSKTAWCYSTLDVTQ